MVAEIPVNLKVLYVTGRGPCHRVVFLDKKLAPHCLSPPRCKKENRRHNTARKVTFYRSENVRRMNAKRGIFKHFRIVHQGENPRFSESFQSGEFEYSFYYPVDFHCSERRKARVFQYSPFL